MLFDQIKKELDTIQVHISKLQKDLSLFPDGELFIYKNGKYIRYELVCNNQRTHISKKDSDTIRLFSQKKYLSASLSDLVQEEKALRSYLACYSHYNSELGCLLNDPAKRIMLTDNLKPVSDELALWSNASYERNPHHPENLKHESISGNKLRSKSEVFIDQALFLHQIPYRYESLLTLDSVSLYPDFTIRHPKTGKIFYWEHFGMMDDMSYANNAFQKLALYNTYDILPTINLITTFENAEHPFSASMAESIITHYFL